VAAPFFRPLPVNVGPDDREDDQALKQAHRPSHAFAESERATRTQRELERSARFLGGNVRNCCFRPTLPALTKAGCRRACNHHNLGFGVRVHNHSDPVLGHPLGVVVD
jgi:hypothetical protein